MNFLSVNKLLRKCNICPSKLILNDNSFYNKMTKILKNININQVGGDYKINLGDGDYIIMHDYIEENQIFFAFRGKTDNLEENINGTPCILLLKDEDRMHISQFDVFGNNCLTYNKKELNGSQILFIIIKFIESKKDKYKIRYITLVDTSIKYCNGIHISLGDFKILISGDTWYGYYGFEPASNMFRKITFSSFEKENYENNKKILEKLTINNSHIEEIIKDYSRRRIGPKGYKTRKISNKVIKSLDNLLIALSTKSDENLSVFLKNYFTKETFSEKCLGLGIIIKELFRKNNLTSFENKMFIKKI